MGSSRPSATSYWGWTAASCSRGAACDSIGCCELLRASDTAGGRVRQGLRSRRSARDRIEGHAAAALARGRARQAAMSQHVHVACSPAATFIGRARGGAQRTGPTFPCSQLLPARRGARLLLNDELVLHEQRWALATRMVEAARLVVRGRCTGRKCTRWAQKWRMSADQLTRDCRLAAPRAPCALCTRRRQLRQHGAHRHRQRSQ
jgi:hypothetical protein